MLEQLKTMYMNLTIQYELNRFKIVVVLRSSQFPNFALLWSCVKTLISLGKLKIAFSITLEVYN